MTLTTLATFALMMLALGGLMTFAVYMDMHRHDNAFGGAAA